jgi:hypothetical protein
MLSADGLIYESNTRIYEMQSHPGRFLGHHASDNANSNGQRLYMEVGMPHHHVAKCHDANANSNVAVLHHTMAAKQSPSQASENQDAIALDRRVYIHCDGSVSPFPLSQILSHTLLT